MDKKYNLGWIFGGLLLAFVSFKMIMFSLDAGLPLFVVGLFVIFYGAINYTSWKNWLKIALSIIFAVVATLIIFVLFLVSLGHSGFGF